MSALDSIIGEVCVQIHPVRDPELDTNQLKSACEFIAKNIPGIRGVGFSEGEDAGPYLNIIFAVVEPAQSWHQIRLALIESSEFGGSLKKCCMCMCTGQNGWDDYLLLYHFDPRVALDEIREA